MKLPFLLKHVFLILAIWNLFLWGCQKKSVPEIEIVARVGDEILTREQLLEWMPHNVQEDQKDLLLRQYVDIWVRNTLLAQAARQKKMELTPYQKWALHNVEKEMLAQAYLDARMPQHLQVTDEELVNYYEKHKEEFKRDDDEVHLVQLYLETLDRAIVKDIRESEFLMDVIKKNYLDSQMNRLMEKNGDLGYVPVSELRKEIQQPVKNGRTGKIYGPIKIEGRFYYFQMLDRQPKGSYRSLDLVKDEIRLRLLNIKRLQERDKLVKKLQANSSVEIHLEHAK